MDLQFYNNLYHCLEKGKSLDQLSAKEKQQLDTAAKAYFIQNQQLFHKNYQKPEQPQRVIKATEVEKVLYNCHSDPLAGHFGIEATYQRILSKYFWPQMLDSIKQYVQSCAICQQHGNRQINEELHPLKVG